MGRTELTHVQGLTTLAELSFHLVLPKRGDCFLTSSYKMFHAIWMLYTNTLSLGPEILLGDPSVMSRLIWGVPVISLNEAWRKWAVTMFIFSHCTRWHKNKAYHKITVRPTANLKNDTLKSYFQLSWGKPRRYIRISSGARVAGIIAWWLLRVDMNQGKVRSAVAEIAECGGADGRL